jgi:hypothetical protein
MAYENIQIANPNFCLSPRSDEFGSIDHSAGVFRFKTSAGVTQVTYTLDNSVTEIKALEYLGPRSLALAYGQYKDLLPVFTLEHVSSSGCLIKKWYIDDVGVSELKLQQTISLTSSGSYRFDCYAMAVENYETTFSAATTTGTGFIQVTSSSGMATGDVLLLGPSTDVDNPQAFEYVTITSVSGSNVYITASGAIPPHYEYVSTNKISYFRNIFLFSDIGQNGDVSRGSIYTINSTSGTVLEVNDSGIYSGVRAASWSRDYQAVGFVQDNNILYWDKTTKQIQKSQVMTNIESDDFTLISVYGLAFHNSGIYRLQLKTTLCNDSGVKTTSSWSTYNYQTDMIVPYTRSIDINPSPGGTVRPTEIISFNGVVRDQFGVALSSKNVKFYDDNNVGTFTPLNGETTSDSNGAFSMIFTLDFAAAAGPPPDTIDAVIKVRVDGSSTTIYGSQYVWDGFVLLFNKRLRIEAGDWTGYSTGLITQVETEVDNFTLLTQVSGVQDSFNLIQLSKFQFPGGDWVGINPPSTGLVPLIKQVTTLSRSATLDQIPSSFNNAFPIDQLKEKTDTGQISQLFISRHTSTGHKDTALINQFQFVVEAVPAFWSEKNPTDTDIYIKIRPYAFSLNQSTLVFKVREVSYVGDTGYVNVTSLCTVTTFDAGGGLLGLNITYNPTGSFHHQAVVYVSIEVYDVAPIPNIILTDYWFKIIPDYRAPYIDNEVPGREEEDVVVSTNIEFDILDIGEGVDISTLAMYVDNRLVYPTVSGISGGYHVFYDPPIDFYYGQHAEIFVDVRDINGNLLHDAWRFYCAGSTGPWIDRFSVFPKTCSRGVYRKVTGISVNVYAIDETGLDPDSILITIGGKTRNVSITPIIYRID